MAKMNLVQFQPGMSMTQFMTRYGTQEQCEMALEKCRWRDGFECPMCTHKGHYVVWHGKAKTFQCHACRSQTTLTSGTIFHSTKLPLTKWFQAMYFLTQSKNNVSALELMRLAGVCYRTAWRLKHKILEVMAEREASRQLEGHVQVDDAYLGGVHPGGKRGRGSPNKVPFIAAVQTSPEGRPLYAVFTKVKTFSKEEVKTWAGVHLAPASTVVSDGLGCFTGVKVVGATHDQSVVGTSRKSSSMLCFRWINTVLSNLKTATSGTYHSIDFNKYAFLYLAEAQYRFNRRFDLSTILTRLLYAAVATGSRPEAWMRLAEDER
ncbi:MAG: IS1595 family transposase [Pseudomonadota bacterium]